MKIVKKFDLGKIKLDLHRELNQGIDLIALDINQGIERGSQFGSAFKPNARATVLKKGFNHPLKHTGLMMNEKRMTKQKATRNRQVAILTPNVKRVDIGYYNDQGTDTIPARPFWGISEKAEKEVMKRIEGRIWSEIKRA